ncbi:MAG TPA: carbohydrate-binding family 9-like protein [Vicinamibacteria bacterium]|nr:carbohydrate-binding family 9-like protein [Vicinamibacteria bacterium]
MNPRYGVEQQRLAHLVCRRAPAPISIDGNLDKPPWRGAERSAAFVDMVSGEPALYDTRVACLWDEERFYLAYWAEEPQVRATLTERDSFIWNDNDLELFVAGEDCYYELEWNAFGTVYECFFVWQDAMKRGGRFDRPPFDLFSPQVDLLGGFQDASRWGRHPRGRRFAFLDFDLAGLQVAVRVDGRINDPTTVDRGWTAELALPWKALAALFERRTLPPAEGETLRCNFFRFQALRVHGRALPENPGSSLNPHGVYDSHIPESFSVVHFTGR